MSPTPPEVALTAKESEVLALVERRLTNAEIAGLLYVSVRTVETHVSSILRKRGVTSRRDLVGTADLAVAPQSRPLPAMRTTLIGRDSEVVAIDKRTRTDRLTTLVGPGGVGKTSIALAVAHARPELASGGVVFVDLVPARDEGDVLQAVADGLGIEGASSSSADLGRHLVDRSGLIIVDNCEHVVDAVARFLHVALGHGGTWRVLATSREPLGLTGEHVVPVEPLRESAAELFVARARQAEPRVDWDASDPRIADLCDRLDGLPLAVELAAGQLRRWSLDELHTRLATSGGHGVLARPARGELRHRSMHTAIAWSYDLLDESEQRVMRHLGVFPSAFGPDDAESLGALLDPIDVVDTLASLVDKSLVVREPDAARYSLLESVKAFAIERLEEEGERASVFEHHRRATVRHARSTSRSDRWFSGSLASRQRGDADHVRQAFWASIAASELADAVELATTRAFLWRNAVGCAEGHRWLAALTAPDAPPVDSTDALWIDLLRCDIAQGDGDFVAMINAADDAVGPPTAVEPEGHAIALHFAALRHLLDAGRVEQVLAEIRLAAPSTRMTALVDAFDLVGRVGRLTVTDVEERALALDRACTSDGYERFVSNWAVWLHGLALREGEIARRGIEQQYVFLRDTGLSETWLTAYSLALSELLHDVGGRAQLAHAVAIAHREGYRIEGDCLLALAYGEVCHGDPARAGELLGLARRRGFNATAHHVLHAIVVAPLVHQSLGPDEYQAAVARGQRRAAAGVLDEYGIHHRLAADA